MAVARIAGEQLGDLDADRWGQWLLVRVAHAAILVSLVQTADMLPDVMFGIVGGVLADTLDRRRLLMAVQGGLVVAGSALAALTIAGRISPALLLMFTFVIGSGSVLVTPAYQSLVPELVPRDQIPAATQLSSINVNIARAIGPAVAGIVIGQFGVGVVFALNAGTFLFFGVVVALWRPAPGTTPAIPERFVSALRAGGRYVRYAPVVRRILLRAALFLVPASALWALLPLVASRRLGLGSSGYGLLLGALGVGAVAGASVLSQVRVRVSTNALIGLVGGLFGAALVAVVLLRSTVVVIIVLVPTGMAWVWMLATVNTLLQLFLPRWVRARGLSIYQMVLFGAQGLGAVVWGVVADAFGLRAAFLIAAALMAVGAASIRIGRLSTRRTWTAAPSCAPTPCWGSRRMQMPGQSSSARPTQCRPSVNRSSSALCVVSGSHGCELAPPSGPCSATASRLVHSRRSSWSLPGTSTCASTGSA